MSDIYFHIFHASPIGMCIIQNKAIQLANAKMLQLFGYPPGELTGLPIRKILAKKDYRRVVKNELHRLAGQVVPDNDRFSIITHPNIVLKVRGYFAVAQYRGQPAILVQIADQTPQNDLRADPNISADMIAAAMENSVKYKEVIDSLPEVVFEMDRVGNIIFANTSAYAFFGATPEDSRKGINALDYVTPFDKERLGRNMEMLLKGEHVGVSEYTIQRKDGRTFPALIHSMRVMRDGCPAGLRGVLIDITERKIMEEKIRHLSLYDSLTGLYNRFYFENELQRIETSGEPFGMIICDMDGLKLINDTLGHRSGDRVITATADAIRNAIRPGDLAARIGGDEFAIILKSPAAAAIKSLIERLQTAVNDTTRDITEIPFTLSCGFAGRENGFISPESVFREADNNMFKEKLFHTQSNRSAVIQTLKKAIETRDFITEGHAERMQILVLELATSIGLSESQKNDLRLLAQFHDVGKVGVPDRILFKPARLTREEKEIMQRHSEYGYRIAQASPDLAAIADGILKHHEWWNGKGYPLGLQGEEIPLECRILSIVDAFDAMTNDRPYRKALSLTAAMREIRKFSGIQFDPELAEKFVEVVEYRV